MTFEAKKKRKPKSERKKLVIALDSIVSLIVRARDKRCVLCGTRQNLTNGHLFSRALYPIRWSLVNCHTQCSGCNFKHEFDPYPYQEWFKGRFGEAAYHTLYREGHNGHKYSNIELREILAQFKQMYEQLN